MGLSGQLKGLTKEYLKDPQGQYFRQLDKILSFHAKSHVPVEKVIAHLQKWIADNRK